MSTPYQDAIGPTRDGEDVEIAVRAFLQKWIMTYVAHVEEAKGDEVGSHPAPRTWEVATDVRTFPEERLPIVLVIDAGTGGGAPKMDGRGRYRAKYGVGIITIASGKDRASSRHNARVYGSAIRNALLIKSSCETDWITGVEWQGDSPDPVPAEQGRSLAAVKSAYLVEAQPLVNSRSASPAVPDQVPPEPVQIQTVEIDLQSEGDQQ